MRAEPSLGRGESLLPLVAVGSMPVLPGSLGVVLLAPRTARRLASQRSPSELALAVSPGPDQEFLPIAVAGRMLGSVSLPDGRVQATVRGDRRLQLLETIPGQPLVHARIRELQAAPALDPVLEEELAQACRGLLDRLPEALKSRSALGLAGAPQSVPADALADLLADELDFPEEERRKLLLELDPRKRLAMVSSFLEAPREQRVEEERLALNTRSRIAKARRESWLRHQLGVIRKELGEDEDRSELERRIAASGMPPEARAEAQRELARLGRLPASSAEAGVAQTWLEFATSLPWGIDKAEPVPFARVRSILDQSHHGLECVKERIAEEIAVMRLSGPRRGAILCFAGPPGTGKTSLGRAIARALGRPYHRISLGGARDESEIRGHRRTYVGAMPGRILTGLRATGASDPVFLIDEVDKLSVGFQGDPAAALLEALDPEQNSAFTDHYLGLPFDLSGVVFLATANLADAIGPALRDRMEIVQLPGYTEEEKVSIATRFLLPATLEGSGLPRYSARATKPALRRLVRHYTREAGVRGLKRALEKAARKVALLRMDDPQACLNLGVRDLSGLFGPPRFRRKTKDSSGCVGTASGLAWTPAGGEILEVEAILVPGSGKEILTGNLGRVMKESVHTALTAVRARHKQLGIRKEILSRADIHLHFPAAAVPKDGPSAGIAIAVAAASVMSGRAPEPGFGLTGELSLRGKILPVGGLKEKLLAACAMGLRGVVLPLENRPDLDALPAELLTSLRIHLVASADEVFELLFPRKRVPHKPVRTEVSGATPEELPAAARARRDS